VISGRSAAKGQAALDELGGGERATFVAGDVKTKADVESLIDTAVERYGTIHNLVNNAGGSSGFALVAELSDEAWQEALDWNLNSTFWATRRALTDARPGLRPHHQHLLGRGERSGDDL
jgi:3-hydroxybutyrate dehydrogenase/3-oxoacyl-[acyl-carrier protein] reductase